MATKTPQLSFKPKAVTKRLVAVLPERAQDIITRRYGLGDDDNRMTLEAIGQIYGITRERVRQIENYSLATIHKSDQYKKEQEAFDELETLVHDMGTVVAEEHFLEHLAKDASTQNHIHFLLVLGSSFVRMKENKHFVHRWHVDQGMAEKVEDAIHKLYANLDDDQLVSESDIIKAFLSHLHDVADKYRDEEILKRWLSLSKNVDSNPLGQWGRADSASVSPRGIRDYAYLVISQHGSPMHFSEVARQIEDVFKKKAHRATTHNELIRDDRFVLVGRGLYALTDWGYMEGVVKDVIKAILKKEGPLTRDEIIDRVLKERYVKENTIAVNLQDTDVFTKNDDGTYALAE